jgi:exodeoxyribonuclease VII large subunit
MIETETEQSGSSTRILSVSDLNRMAREVLAQSFPLFWISGEISNLTRAASGHWYFSLKDQSAQVRCVMFRGRNSYLDWTPKEGDKVEARAVVTLYEARGDFQLTVEFLQRAGLGALFEAFEKLKAKLQAQGLFDQAFKQSLPSHPKQIGIVTSPNAAALHDVLTTLKRRMPSISIVIYPTPVQGKGASNHIANAIHLASERAECDVLIICRGGGSMEDLWQFNEEVVAHAIVNCKIPIVSGVGHETDFTICDFVADVRAATPTAAAELVSPSRTMLLAQLHQVSTQLNRSLKNLLNQKQQALDYLAKRLISPTQQVDYQKQQLSQIKYRLNMAIQKHLQNNRKTLHQLNQNLQHLNPNAVLTRGYAFAENSQGQIINNANQLSANDQIKLTFGIGSADVKVVKIHHD